MGDCGNPHAGRKDLYLMNKLFCALSWMVLFLSCTENSGKTNESEKEVAFKFAFMTDVHMSHNNAETSAAGLKQALDHAKSENVDFVIFGGDLMDLDHLQPQDSVKAESVVERFKSVVAESGVKAYFTIGNHDRYYTFQHEADSAGFKLFEMHFGDTYYSFDHKGVHYVILNSVQINEETKNYSVGPMQLEWLKADLATISPETPLVVVTHVPFQSLYYPAMEGMVKDVDMFSNFKEVWDLLLGYDLKVIFQGHQHLYEEMFVNRTHFVTGGAVCASWWGGPLLDTEEGYMLVDVYDDGSMSWRYMDYGWEAEK